MLQNPSKYHPNPLSHFLALHSTTQAPHNVRNNNGIGTTASHILTNVSAFGFGGDQQQHRNGSFQQQQQQQQNNHPQQQQQHQNYHHLFQQQQQQQQQALLTAAQQKQQETTHTMIQHNLSGTTHARHHAQFLDATGTTLDVGKSFTIAAILGLQNRNGMEHTHRKDYNSVINLSLNGGGNGASGGGGNVGGGINSDVGENNNQLRQRCGTPPIAADEINKIRGEKLTSNQDNNDDNCQSDASDSNKFHCDNNNILVNPYLPITTSATSLATTTNAIGNTNVFRAASLQHNHHHHHHHQQQQQQQQQHQLQHPNANQHQNHHHHHHSLMSVQARAAAAVAAVNAVVNGTPTALQSLQQLHQHHAHQTSLNFSREKLKSDNHAKKSSLKNKRVRTIFTPEQLERLEAEFERQQYMVGPERLYLAHTLQLTEAQVKVWFQNRRIKWRKHHLELTQQRLALLRQNQLPGNNIAAGISSLASPDGLVTAASNSSFDENDEPTIKSEHENLTNSQKSHTESDSELSVCNDSIDADSITDGGGDT